ncbi:MAG: hypothetical protein KAR56_03255, partial [Thermoplasmata archaeon]|nr:hypothetical protein [Thermoplasmata archaeon]
MIIKKISIAIIAMTLILSGLGIMAVGQDAPAEIDRLPIGNEPRSVQRVVLAEDFTNIDCGACPGHDEKWTPAIEQVGYSVVAPAYTHVHWPDPLDEWNVHENMYECANNRRRMLGFSGVPNAWIDGTGVAESRPTAEYVQMFNDRAAVPANVSITTSGYINPTSRLGTISIHAEAVETIGPGDYRLMVYIWENNVSRYAPYPNGEAEQDWAVWFMMPDEKGKAIWTTGASVGESVDVSHNFKCESDWNLSEMGSTVFIQRFDTFEVEQAAVDLFDDPVPTHDVSVIGTNILPVYDFGSQYTLDCTVYNTGTSNESNLEVKLIEDGVTQDTQYIVSLSTDTPQVLNFSWTAPSIAGFYNLSFEVSTVSGETLTSNNIWTQNIEVIYYPDIYLGSGGLDFTVASNENGIENFTIGNNGTKDCNFEINIGSEYETFGAFGSPFLLQNTDRGNLYLVTSDTILWKSEFYLEIKVTTDLYHFVYEGNALTGSFNKISEVHVADSGTGTGFYSSGAINVPLTAGKYYYIGACWNGSTSSGYRVVTLPVPTIFGSLQTGVFGSVANYPPADPVTQTWSGQPVAFYQRLRTGAGQPSWLSSVTPSTGVVSPGTEDPVSVNVYASGLRAGFTDSTFISVSSDDRDEPKINIPVNLTVVVGHTGSIFLDEEVYNPESTAT